MTACDKDTLRPDYAAAQANWYAADNVFYDASVIGGTADNFTIAGELSLACVFYQLAPVLSNNFNFDMMPMLEKWISLGNVSGSVTFSDGNFATMSTAQQISVFAPQEDLDFLAYNVDNFPDMLISFFESKKLTVPILGDIDFNKPFADGIRLSADITSSASYKILSADATFDSVKEDYENSRTDEQL